MFQFEEAGAAMTGEDVVRVIVAILTALAALLAPRLGARHDDLQQAERLTTLLPDLASPERDLLRQLRDDHAVVWGLRQAAPVLPRLRLLVRMAYYGGILVLLAAPVALLLTPGYQWWFWIAYLAGAVLLAVGVMLDRVRTDRRRAWMSAERARRGLRAPVDDRLFLEVASDPERRTGRADGEDGHG